MASKKRGGLSKREYAAQAKAKAAPKVSSRAVASKAPVATGPAIGPLMPGQIRSNSGPAIGPLLPNQTRATSSSSSSSKSSSSSRDLASKAQKSKLNPASSVKAAEASGLLGTMSSVPNRPQSTIKTNTGGGIFDRLKNKGIGAMGGIMETFGKAAHDRGAGMTIDDSYKNTAEDLASNRRFAYDNTLGISGASASVNTDIPTGYGDNGEIFYNGNDRMGPLASDFAKPGTNFSRPGSEEAYLRGEDPRSMAGTAFGIAKPVNPFAVPTAKASDGSEFANRGETGGKKKDWVNPWGDVDISGEGSVSSGPSPYQPTQEEIAQQNNEDFGGGSMIDTSSGTTGNRSGRGSGQFGTGKGVQGDDPYIKELRKAYSSNGGEKWLRKQFEELISALDPTYAQMQKEGTDALNAQLNNQNVQLASVMNANNVGDSEQRAQMMAGQQRDTSTALGNLLAKLAQNKSQDVSGYKAQEAEAMSKYSQNKQQDARTLLEKIQAYKGQQGQGQTAGRMTSPAVPKTQKLSRNDVFNWVEDALGKGYSWQEIAENAQEQGIGTETGGYLDQLLNQANKQNRYR